MNLQFFLGVYEYHASTPYLYYHLTLKLRLLENWFYSKGHKSRSHWMSQLKSKNVFLFQFRKCVTILQQLSEFPKTFCLSCKIPIFTGLHLGVVTPILGNPFCLSDAKPSLGNLFNVHHEKWTDLVWKFYIFWSNFKVIFSNGGKLRDIDPSLCSIVLETLVKVLLSHISMFLADFE